METEANKAPKKKSILYRQFGCSDELDASALIGAADCRQDSSRCADGPDNIEVRSSSSYFPRIFCSQINFCHEGVTIYVIISIISFKIDMQ
jgi:hypothetical protein